jgi:cytochrome d ubiquinol oxidase subunit I
VATTLVSFIVVYFVLFGAGVYYILRLMSKPPADKEAAMVPASPVRAGGMMASAAGITAGTQTNASTQGGRA